MRAPIPTCPPLPGSKPVGVAGIYPFYYETYQQLFDTLRDCEGPDFLGDKLRSKEFGEKLHNSDDANDFDREEKIAMAWMVGIPIWEIDGKIQDPPPLAFEKKNGTWYITPHGGEALPLHPLVPLDSFVRGMTL